MLFMSSPSQAVYAAYNMRVLPRLTIDRILLLFVLLSVIYLILYGTHTLDEEKLKGKIVHNKTQHLLYMYVYACVCVCVCLYWVSMLMLVSCPAANNVFSRADRST